MALNKRTGMDLRAINRDQKAIDALPNKGRATTSHSKALEKAKGGKKDSYYGSAEQQKDIDKNVAGIHKYNKEHPIKMSH